MEGPSIQTRARHVYFRAGFRTLDVIGKPLQAPNVNLHRSKKTARSTNFILSGEHFRWGLQVTTDQRDPEVFVWPSGFLEAWGTKAKQPHMFNKILVCVPCRRKRQGKTNIIFLKMCGCLALVPMTSNGKIRHENLRSGPLGGSSRNRPQLPPPDPAKVELAPELIRQGTSS